MSKTFRPWDVDQAWLLPPALDDFVPAGHPAHLVRDLVRASLDLDAVMAWISSGERRRRRHDPEMGRGARAGQRG